MTVISTVDIEKGRVLLILGLLLFVKAFFDTTLTYFQAFERQDIYGYLNLANNFVLILAGIGFVVFQKNLLYFASAPIIAGIITSGNTVITVMGQDYAPLLTLLAEVCATSDVPAGVVNLLSGDRKELLPHVSSHMDINAIAYADDFTKKDLEGLKLEAVNNLKRVVGPHNELGLKPITDFTEAKTVWSPVGI